MTARAVRAPRKAATADELRKSSIKSAVRGARAALAAGFERRLALLGIFTDGKRLAREAVADQWAAQRDRPGVEAALARWEQQGFDATGAVERFIREGSYTWLNRLSAIRALEVRGVVRPIANLDEGGTRPAIVATLAEVSPALYQAQEVAEALLWQEVFQELALQLGALFDPLDPHGLFPDSTAVLGALQALAQLDDATWREDDTLGWLYQFFTTKDERAALRKKKGAAFTADDLGPINQFYTPGWIVRFLTDNTLGVLWRRMKPDTKIGEFCQLLLPATDDDTPIPLKRVRDIKIIDPACGTMHFGVYAFDVLRRMYEEEGIENPHAVPRLILEQNLAGIDIDRRAIQIAALNLYLKAAAVLRELGEHEPPRDLHLNLGCADAAPPSGEQQAKLRAEIADPTLREAVDVALSSLKYLHAVGSLLDVEADVRAALAQKTKVLPKGISPLPGLLAQVGMIEDAEPTQLDALVTRAREVAEAALRSDDLAGALVAEDAMLAAKVLQLVNQRYDVVLMNPPYGTGKISPLPPATKQYLHQRYPKSKADIYGAFFELAFRLADSGGAVGALTSKTFLYLTTFRNIRQHLTMEGRLSALIDGGDRVLYESDVDVAATVAWCERVSPSASAYVFRLVREPNREERLRTVIAELNQSGIVSDATLYRPSLASLRTLPTGTIAYWAPPALLRAYQKYPALEPTYGEVRQGLATGDDERFLRYWWEVPGDAIGEGKRWVRVTKGGDYSPYYESLLRVIDWKDDGDEVRRFKGAVIRNSSYYFREGITYPFISDRFNCRYLPPGCIFSTIGSGIFTQRLYELLGYLNSRVAQVALMAQSATRAFQTGEIGRICVPPLDGELGRRLAVISAEAVRRAERFAEGDELDRRFVESWAEATPERSLSAAALGAVGIRKMFLSQQIKSQVDSTDLVGNEMGFSANDWAQIERTFGREIGEDKRLRVRNFRDDEVADPLQRQDEHVKRCVSSLVSKILLARKTVELESLTQVVREKLRSRFDEGDASEAFARIVGKPLGEWLRCDYQSYHLQRRAGRPFILMLAGPNKELMLLVDVLRSGSADLRQAIAELLEPIARQAQAAVSAGKRGDIALRDQRLLEDSQFMAKFLGEATNNWDAHRDDVRPRVVILRPLAPYLNEKESRRGYAG